jgi:hypothetical protein
MDMEVSSCVIAAKDNNIGVVGVAPDVELYRSRCLINTVKGK